MSEHDKNKDPWADLAESLGAKPASEPQRPATPPAPPAGSASRQPPKARESRPTAQSGSDWGGLAASLGLEPTAEASPPPAVERG
ncbi:MAG: hypothetical protein ACKOTB_11840 [Planctomycetia bacterium]